MSTTQIVLQLIRSKQYDLPYRNQGKPIHLIGIAFDPEKRNIAEWVTEVN
ncbi:MAG: PD-(D/E)XK nuclease domain-containing protein [Caldilineaceae bacterium]